MATTRPAAARPKNPLKTSSEVETPISSISDLDEAEKRIKSSLEAISKLFRSPCFPLMIPDSLGPNIVDDIYEQLRSGGYKRDSECLIVVIDSGGGDINSAYNLALLFRRYAKSLHFIVPRWAKSAATLLVCSGDQISMTPVAELGPVDPQITVFNPL
jgi:ATP-dependent protease ClpP protease subunit